MSRSNDAKATKSVAVASEWSTNVSADLSDQEATPGDINFGSGDRQPAAHLRVRLIRTLGFVPRIIPITPVLHSNIFSTDRAWHGAHTSSRMELTSIRFPPCMSFAVPPTLRIRTSTKSFTSYASKRWQPHAGTSWAPRIDMNSSKFADLAHPCRRYSLLEPLSKIHSFTLSLTTDVSSWSSGQTLHHFIARPAPASSASMQV